MAKKCELILEQVSMEDLCNYYGLTQFRGKKYVCPFHPDKNPSACISKDNFWFRCYGCGISYNVIHFVCRYENCTKPTAIAHLDNYFGLGLSGNLTKQELAEIERAKKLRAEKKAREEKFKKDSCKILSKIVAELRMWEDCERHTHLTQLEYLSGEWKYADLYFYSLKQQRWLNWLYEKLCDIPHEESEFDFIYRKETAKSMMLKILDKEIEI